MKRVAWPRWARCGAAAGFWRLVRLIARTDWYRRADDLSRRCGVDVVLDLGLHDQSEFLDPVCRSLYHFVFSGLTPSELASLDTVARHDGDRAIPWAFVGHVTPYRAALVDLLVQQVDPSGFVYMPRPVPYTEKGSPHLNQEQFERVLQRTKYQVWCSHHDHFYLEPERFRASLLSGGLPMKVVFSSKQTPAASPFSYLLMEAGEAVRHMRMQSFTQVRRRFWSDWRARPTLVGELARVFGLPASSARVVESHESVRRAA